MAIKQTRVISDVRPRKAAVKIPVRQTEPTPKRPRLSFKMPAGRKIVLSFAAILVLVIFIISIPLTAKMTLKIVPKKTAFDLGSGITISVDAEEFSADAAKRGEAESKSAGDFNNKASGSIIVYNNFSSATQVLVATTRFESPEGLIYRTTERVVIPGKSSDEPGSIEVNVVADKPGEEYNIGLTDFTIPGFEGGPRFQGFYGRSKTEMKGGAIGKGKVVGREESEALLDKLESEIRAELEESINSKITGDYEPLPYEHEETELLRVIDPPVGSPAEKFFGEVRGEWKTLAVRSDKYSDAVAKVLFQDRYADGMFKLHDTSEINVQSIIPDYERKRVTLSLGGKAVFEWLFDEGELRNVVLAAENKSALDEIFRGYPAISRVEAVYKPRFYKRIPRKQEKLYIEIED